MIARSWISDLDHKTALVAAEWALFAGNIVWVLQSSSVVNAPKEFIFHLGFFSVYRLVLFNRLKAGSSFAAWWYCVIATASALRFAIILFAQGSSFVIVTPTGVAFIASVIAIRSTGALAIFCRDLNRTNRMTAGIVIALALVSFIHFHSEVLLLSAFDGWIYGANIRLH